MIDVAKFREKAEYAWSQAAAARTSDEKQLWLGLAENWSMLADEAERRDLRRRLSERE